MASKEKPGEHATTLYARDFADKPHAGTEADPWPGTYGRKNGEWVRLK